MRAVGGILAGVIAGGVAMVCVALVGGLLFPSAARVDGFDTQAALAVFPSLPTGAKIAVILSWLAAALVGGMVAKKIAGGAWAAWTVTGVYVAYVLLTVNILPMPAWLQAMAVAAPLFGGLIANHLVADRRPFAETSADADL